MIRELFAAVDYIIEENHSTRSGEIRPWLILQEMGETYWTVRTSSPSADVHSDAHDTRHVDRARRFVPFLNLTDLRIPSVVSEMWAAENLGEMHPP